MRSVPPHLAGSVLGLGASPRAVVHRAGQTDVLTALVEARQRREPCVLCTVIESAGSSPRKLGAKMLVFADHTIVGTIGGGAIELQIVDDAVQALKTAVPSMADHHLTHDLGMCCGGRMRVFLEPQLFAPRLLLFGAGHVAQPLAAMATLAGFEVTVVDQRPDWANETRFPDVANVRPLPPLSVIPSLPVGTDVFVVILTHDHGLDQDILEQYLRKDMGYVGVIGSLRKREKFRQRLRAAGFDDHAVGTFRTPMGLDIGAVTPEEIAVSVLAELIAVRRGKQDDQTQPMSVAKTGSARQPDSGDDA